MTIYKCISCNYETKNKYDYKRHEESYKHINVISKNKAVKNTFKCIYCENMFKSLSGLSRHKKYVSK